MPRPDTSRQRYITLAAKHFAQHGVNGTSLATIARDADVSKQALLHYFPSKASLYSAVLVDLSDRLIEQVDDARADSAEAHLATYFANRMQQSLENPQDAQLIAQSLLNRELSSQVWPMKPCLYRLAAILKQCQSWQRASTEDTLAAIYQIIAMIQHYAISAPTLSEMLGHTTFEATRTTHEAQVRAAIDRILG